MAIGELMVDVYHDKGYKPIGFYIGGSIWNDLNNLSMLDERSHRYCVALCGTDNAGIFCVQTLRSNGIDVSNVRKVNMRTKRIHIVVDAQNTRSQLMCPLCQETCWDSVSFPPIVPPTFLVDIHEGIVIIDTLIPEVLDFAYWLKKRGWFIAADIGFIDHFISLDLQKNWEIFYETVDLLQVPQKVFLWLGSRLSITCVESLYNILKCKYLNVTNGKMGSTFVYKNRERLTRVINSPATKANVVDPTGAGDAFFSFLLYKLDNFGNFIDPIEKVLSEANMYAGQRVSYVGAVAKLCRIPYNLRCCRGCVFPTEKVAYNGYIT